MTRPNAGKLARLEGFHHCLQSRTDPTIIRINLWGWLSIGATSPVPRGHPVPPALAWATLKPTHRESHWRTTRKTCTTVFRECLQVGINSRSQHSPLPRTWLLSIQGSTTFHHSADILQFWLVRSDEPVSLGCTHRSASSNDRGGLCEQPGCADSFEATASERPHFVISCIFFAGSLNCARLPHKQHTAKATLHLVWNPRAGRAFDWD